MIDWYLLKPPYDQLSGFEGEVLEDWGQTGFEEVLDSEVADEVEIYNYDLSVCKVCKVMVQNNHQDTKLKTMQRMMFAPIGTCTAGMYVKYHGRFWLIIGIVDHNKIYEKAILLICNYQITWMNDDGKVVQRWANAESASQYNNGETGSQFYFVRSDQLMVYMPDDDEVLKLNSGKRFVIDKRIKMYEKSLDESVDVCTDNPLVVYQITRSDTVLDDYTDSGIVAFIMSQDEQEPDDGYYRINGTGYWLCGAPKIIVEPSGKSKCDIIMDSDVVYIDLEPALYKAVFYGDDGAEVSLSPEAYKFYIEFGSDQYEDSDFEHIDVYSNGNIMMVSANDSSLANKTFSVILEAKGYDTVTKIVTIKEFI